MSTRKAELPQPDAPRLSGLQEYFQGVVKELKIAEWPSRAELIRLTQVVLTLIGIVAMYCGGLDFLLSLVTNKLFNR